MAGLHKRSRGWNPWVTRLVVVLLLGLGPLLLVSWYRWNSLSIGTIVHSERRPREALCRNTCSGASNGVCEEPRETSSGQPSTPVKCDLGTDCTDCGPWQGHHMPAEWLQEPASSAGPVSYARLHGHSVRIKRTSTMPSFLLPITDAKADPDVSSMLENYGAAEGGLSRAMHEMLALKCHDRKTGKRGLVLEVGAGHGYYAILAARYGCRVIAWEPVPLLRAHLALAVALNNVSDLVQVRSAAVSDLPVGSTVSIGVPKKGVYRSSASVDNMALEDREVAEVIQAKTETIDSVVDSSEEVLLLKLDVGGYEARVLKSASQLLSSRSLYNVLLGYAPGIAEDLGSFDHSLSLLHALAGLIHDGFALGHVSKTELASPWPPRAMADWYAQPFPVVPEIGLEEIVYDIRALRQQNATEGDNRCQVPILLRNYTVWSDCEERARMVHPKGFRSLFGYSTAVWATRHFKRLNDKHEKHRQHMEATESLLVSSATNLLRLRGYAAFFHRGQTLSGSEASWTSRLHPKRGLGWVECAASPPDMAVVHRCPCNDSACADEEVAVQQLTRYGLMLYN